MDFNFRLRAQYRKQREAQKEKHDLERSLIEQE